MKKYRITLSFGLFILVSFYLGIAPSLAQTISLTKIDLYHNTTINELTNPRYYTYFYYNSDADSTELPSLAKWSRSFYQATDKRTVIFFDAQRSRLVAFFMKPAGSEKWKLNGSAILKIDEVDLIFGFADLEPPLMPANNLQGLTDTLYTEFQCIDGSNGRLRTFKLDWGAETLIEQSNEYITFEGGKPSRSMMIYGRDGGGKGIAFYRNLFISWQWIPLDTVTTGIKHEFCQFGHSEFNYYQTGSVTNVANGTDGAGFLMFDKILGIINRFDTGYNRPELQGFYPDSPFLIARLPLGENWSAPDTTIQARRILGITWEDELPIVVDRDGRLWITSRQTGKLLVLENAYISNHIYDEDNLNMLQEVTIPTQFTGVNAKILSIDASMPDQLTICFYGGVQTFSISD